MAGRLEGKVALISGAARGQGRSHAVRLAQEGADIIAFDVCRQLPTVGYKMATPEDLKETAKQVEDLDRRIIAREADVRDGAAVRAARRGGRRRAGPPRHRAAPTRASPRSPRTPGRWRTTSGRRRSRSTSPASGRRSKAAIPRDDRRGQRRGDRHHQLHRGHQGHGGHRALHSSKHGVVGLMRTLAIELAPHSIRVNTVHPTGVNTPMVVNDYMAQFLAEDVAACQHGRTCCRSSWSKRWTSPTPCCGWPPTRPATSPAPASRSTRGSCRR